MTDPAGIPALMNAIRHLHGCESRHVETFHVRARAPTGEVTWEGDVEAFTLIDHPKAKKAYAWSEATIGRKLRFVVVLSVPPVDSPMAAVRASILAGGKR